MKLETLSLTELKDLEQSLPAAIQAKKAAETERVKSALEHEAEKYGFKIVDIFGDGAKWKNPIKPKYRDPKTGKTWSARGRAPLWMPKRKGDWHKLSIDAR